WPWPRGGGTSTSVPGLIVREPDTLNDELLARLRRGDARAFEELVKTYQHRVFGVGLRMLGSRAEAEEIAQETFLRAPARSASAGARPASVPGSTLSPRVSA